MITTNNAALAEKARSLKSLAFGQIDKFMHTDIGYNYRMTNLQAAIGVAQLERIDQILEMRKKTEMAYKNSLADIETI